MTMKTPLQQVLFWAPRILGLLFAAFISLFALDVFGEHRGFWQTLLALGIHLIPTALLLAVIAVSWRWEWVGAIVFPGLALFYLVSAWGRLHWSAYAAISGPMFLLGALFLVSWRLRSPVHHQP